MGKPAEKVVRLPLRQGSFADLEDQGREEQYIGENHVIDHPLADADDKETNNSSNNIRSSLFADSDSAAAVHENLSSIRQENERLRRQIEELQSQMSILQRQHYQVQRRQQPREKDSYTTKKHGPNGTTAVPLGAPGVVLELPRAMRHNNNYNNNKNRNNIMSVPLNCLKGSKHLQNLAGVPKDHQSFATDDDQSTIEPSPDWDVHESLRGLKHRGSGVANGSGGNNYHHGPSVEAPHPAHRRKLGSPSATTTDETRKTEALTDGSFSSDGQDDSDTRLDLESNDYDDDDDDDGYVVDELEVVTRALIGNRSSSERQTAVRTRSSGGESSVEGEESFWASVSDRAGWLVGLLVLQSMSSFILARNEDLLKEHVVIVQFLTMLVGAGGNAGNQASVRVIRGLAVGAIDDSTYHRFLRREFIMGAALSLILGTAGCIRAVIFMTPFLETVAITTSLFMIVIISIVLGASMPLGMKWVGIDPAHSSTTIQVVMDILGVTITVWMSAMVLDSGFRNFLLSSTMDA